MKKLYTQFKKMSDSQGLSNSLLLKNYLTHIAHHPVSMVPYNKNALLYLAAKLDQDVSASGLFSAIGLAGPQSSQGWQSVQPGPFDFPNDHGPHWGIRNEWYYLACNLTYNTNKPLYLLLAIIRRGTNPKVLTPQAQVVACEATIEMPGVVPPYITASAAFDGFKSEVVFTAPGNPGFQWSAFNGSQLFGLASDTGVNMFPMRCGIDFSSTSGPVQCQLTLDAVTDPPFFLQGDNGCAPCLDGLGYKYYSWPALQVSGTVRVGSNTLQVSGQGWLDHQWGSRMQPLGYVDNIYVRALGILGSSYPKTLAPQWDWFFMHLSNGLHLTTAVLPSKGFMNPVGPVTLTNTTIIAVDSNNKLTYETFPGGTVTYSNWVQVNCNLYASSWVLEWKNIQLTCTVTQPAPAGFSTGVDGQTFMEKGMVVNGTINGTAVTGTGFAEAIGYDSVEKQVFNMLSNLMAPDEAQVVLSMFLPASASPLDITLASLLVIGPPVVILVIIVVAVTVALRKKRRFK
jgi:predicted secreted hydrolase